MNISIVIGMIWHEGNDNLKAFASFDDAVKFKESCEKHEEKRPRNYEDDSFSDEIKAWEEIHPAKCTVYDEFEIEEMTLDEADNA